MDKVGFTQLSDSLKQVGPAPATLKDGSTFTLAPRIKDKIAKGEPFNYLLSIGSLSLGAQGDQFLAGYNSTVGPAGLIYPIDAKWVAPSGPCCSVQAQQAQFEAAVNTDQVDCLTVLPQDNNSFNEVINRIMAAGIPVFTATQQEGSNAFADFTQEPEKEGAQVAETVAKFFQDNGTELKEVTMSSGLASAAWAQGRMTGFESKLKELVPGVTFVNDTQNALAADFDPAKALDQYKAYLTGHPNTQLIMNTDIGAQYAARAIAEQGLSGKAYSIGWNVTGGDLDQIAAGNQIATFDQEWGQQAGFGALACAVFLSTGQVAPNAQYLTEVNKGNLDEARAKLDALLSGPKMSPAP